MACEHAWEFPLTQRQKVQRVLILFQDEVERAESEISELKGEKSGLKLENEKLQEQVEGLQDQLCVLKARLRESRENSAIESESPSQNPPKPFPFMKHVAATTCEASAFFDNATKKMATDTEQTVEVQVQRKDEVQRKAEVPKLATGALQALQEESVKASDIAFSESAKAIELVRDNCDGAFTEQGRLQKLAQAQQDFLSDSWRTPRIQKSLREKGVAEFQRKDISELPRPLKVKMRSIIPEHANDVTRKVQQAGESYSPSSLWSWGQDIMNSVRLPIDAVVTRQALGHDEDDADWKRFRLRNGYTCVS